MLLADRPTVGSVALLAGFFLAQLCDSFFHHLPFVRLLRFCQTYLCCWSTCHLSGPSLPSATPHIIFMQVLEKVPLHFFSRRMPESHVGFQLALVPLVGRTPRRGCGEHDSGSPWPASTTARHFKVQIWEGKKSKGGRLLWNFSLPPNVRHTRLKYMRSASLTPTNQQFPIRVFETSLLDKKRFISRTGPPAWHDSPTPNLPEFVGSCRGSILLFIVSYMLASADILAPRIDVTLNTSFRPLSLTMAGHRTARDL